MYFVVVDFFFFFFFFFFFYWRLSDSKSPQVCRTHLSILTYFSYAVIWMVSIRSLISHFNRFSFLCFRGRFKGHNYAWCQCYFHVPQPFHFSSKVLVFVQVFAFFSFNFVVWSSLLLLLLLLLRVSINSLGCPRGVMVKAMDCRIVVREFVLQSRYYVHFRANTLGKGMNPLILPYPPTTFLLGEWLWH